MSATLRPENVLNAPRALTLFWKSRIDRQIFEILLSQIFDVDQEHAAVTFIVQ